MSTQKVQTGTPGNPLVLAELQTEIGKIEPGDEPVTFHVTGNGAQLHELYVRIPDWYEIKGLSLGFEYPTEEGRQVTVVVYKL